MRRCTKCHRALRGHNMPTGEKCELVALDEAELARDTSSDDEDDKYIEVIAQLGRLTATVNKLVQDSPAEGDARLGAHFIAPNPFRESQSSDCGWGRGGQQQQHRGWFPNQVQMPPYQNITVDNHAYMGNETSNRQIPLFTGARVPMKVLDTAKAGEFVNLVEFLPCLETSGELTPTIENNQIVVKPKRLRRSIDSFSSWCQAWTGYESLLVSQSPDLYVPMAQYRLYIQELDIKYKWPAVYSYDCQHRNQLSITHSMVFNQVSMEILTSTCLTTGAAKQNVGCFRCQSIFHHVKECPFQDMAPGEKEKPQKSSSPTPSLYQTGSYVRQPSQNNNSTQQQASQGYSQNRNPARQPSSMQEKVCTRFNAGSCNDSRCVRRHVCSSCRTAPTPYPRCQTCTLPPTAPRGAFTLNQGNLGPMAPPPSR